jgi:hypothetical protein
MLIALEKLPDAEESSSLPGLSDVEEE